MAVTIRQYSHAHADFRPQTEHSHSDTDLSESCVQEEAVSYTNTHMHAPCTAHTFSSVHIYTAQMAQEEWREKKEAIIEMKMELCVCKGTV